VKSGNVKYCSETNTKTLERVFNSNLVTYFPSYRHEQPGYLNDPYKINLEYGLSSSYAGHLRNPIEVITDLPRLANWMMDVVLDRVVYNSPPVQLLFQNINSIFSNTLSIKSERELSIGIGERTNGATRIQIGERDTAGNWRKTIYPSIFNMSAGENALICLFGEIVRQSDRIWPNGVSQIASGIVLIDEIDKHLHIRMQKDILPGLMQLFPNIQFVISSHSPFISMGLEENDGTKSRTQLIDLDNGGVISDLTITRVFAEGYDAMIEKNKQYRHLYEAIKAKEASTKLQIISEGHNIEHIKKAISVLDNALLSQVEFPYSEKTGKEQLKTAYEALYCSNPQTRYIFVWDCDFTNKSLSENEHFFKFIFEENTYNTKVKKGIENLYPAEMFASIHYTRKEWEDEYGAKKSIQEFDKNAFLDTVKTDNDSLHFQNFWPLVEKTKSILMLT